MLLPVTMRSNMWVCGRPLAGIAGSNPAGGMDVCLFTRSVLSGIGDRDELIVRSEESYRMWGAECDPETSQRTSRTTSAVDS